jgi:hypothetical protein
MIPRIRAIALPLVKPWLLLLAVCASGPFCDRHIRSPGQRSRLYPVRGVFRFVYPALEERSICGREVPRQKSRTRPVCLDPDLGEIRKFSVIAQRKTPCGHLQEKEALICRYLRMHKTNVGRFTFRQSIPPISRCFFEQRSSATPRSEMDQWYLRPRCSASSISMRRRTFLERENAFRAELDRPAALEGSHPLGGEVAEQQAVPKS